MHVGGVTYVGSGDSWCGVDGDDVSLVMMSRLVMVKWLSASVVVVLVTLVVCMPVVCH